MGELEGVPIFWSRFDRVDMTATHITSKGVTKSKRPRILNNAGKANLRTFLGTNSPIYPVILQLQQILHNTIFPIKWQQQKKESDLFIYRGKILP